MLLGLDFDNTLISYDEVFFSAARGKELVPPHLSVNKTSVRDFMRNQGLEEEWIQLQGEVYGLRITEALPFPGMMQALKEAQARGVELCLVSHKTRIPYRGPRHDLHQAARDWLRNQGFFAHDGLCWGDGRVFFEETKEEKIARIITLGCTHYVDDLPEILEMLPKTVTKILYDPSGVTREADNWLTLHSWCELERVLR